jgi:hypothetical protein
MGQFAVSGLMPGEYSVNTQHPGYIPDKDQVVAIGDGEPEILRLGMLPAGGLEGRIENLKGNWWLDTRLILKRIDTESGVDPWDSGSSFTWPMVYSRGPSCAPQPDGRFHVKAIPPGTYQVELWTYRTDPKPQIVRLDELLEEVVIRAGETATYNARAP